MRRSPAVLVLVLALLAALPALAQGSRFPSDDPDPRVGTPNDPGFDCSEPDDEDDVDGDGAVTVDDWVDDSRVTDANDNDLLDGQDLIRAFSDGTDADDNGYVDDIAGWDFFDDDNDPSDDSSYSAASGHGTGRGREAAAETDNAVGDAGVCPDCRVMMLREYDSFVLPGDRYAAATVYAADNGALVQVVANGVLTNSAAAREAAAHAAASGMALMHVSSDLNTANHNYPTNYRQSVFINGCVTDTHGLGTEIPGLQPVVDALGLIDSQVPPTTYFRQSNLTLPGVPAAVCFMAETGSQATGQAGGAAGLLHSRALEVFGEPLTSDEVKQLLTMTADDVTAADTGVIGTPDPAQDGFDPHFGYGRANLAAAVAAVGPGTVPPEAWIDDPAWWTLVDPVTTTELEVRGHVAAERSAGWSYELQWAPGNAPLDTDFTTVVEGDGTAPVDELLGTIPMADVAAAVPGAAGGTPPSDPDERTFTVRLVATDADGNRGEDRKVYFAHHDPAAHDAWPIFTDSGGETSLVFADLDGDGTSEIIDADSSGRLWVRDHAGETVPWFNDGEPFLLPPAFFHHPGSAAHSSGAVPAVTGGWRTPAVADIDGDLSADIVGTTFDGRLFALDRRGDVLDGFPVSVDPALAANPTSTDHRKRGFLAAPTIADLDGDGTREVIAAALDGHLYVWAGDGSLHDGFPLRLADPAQEEYIGGELIGTPAVGDVDGDGDLEIVSGSSEVYGATQPTPGGIEDTVGGLVTNLAANAIGGSSRLYVVHHDGTFADGWPVAVNGLLPDILPLVGPQHIPALADVDGDGDDEIAYSITTGDLTLYDGDGSTIRAYTDELPSSPTLPVALNLFEYPAIGDLDGDGGLDVVKGGLSATGAVNLVLVGQNLPQQHLVQAWSMDAIPARPGWPVEHDDYQLLSAPAIADVDGVAGAEVLATSGRYLLRGYGGDGSEVDGFPKLTGGWVIGTPPVGDVDGDGLVEIGVGTREGWRFLWDTDTPVGQLDWTSEGHDLCHTANHGTDCTPPARVTDLTVDGSTATFSPTGDDGRIREAVRYEVRGASRAITSFEAWTAATVLTDDLTPSTADGALTVDLPAGVTEVAVVAHDDAGNASAIAHTGVEVVRVAGEERIATAVEVSRLTHDTAEVVVVARADEYADALAGAPLAVQEDAPLLLSTRDALSPATAAEVTRLGATRAIVLGGTAALAPEVAEDLAELGLQVARIEGPTRFHTAAAIAEAFPADGEALLVEGINADPTRGWPDALAASALGGTAGVPVLLTAADVLPPATAVALTGRSDVTIVGGTAAVSQAVATQVEEAVGRVTRIAGATRTETARVVAEEALDRGAAAEVVWLATTTAFPDGLVAGAAAAHEGGVLLLVDRDTLSADAPAAAFLATHREALSRIRIAGGVAAISTAVQEAVAALLG